MHKKATKHSSHVLIVGHSNDDNVSPLCWTLVLFLLHCSFRVYPFFLACHLVFVQPLFFFPIGIIERLGFGGSFRLSTDQQRELFIVFPISTHTQPSTLAPLSNIITLHFNIGCSAKE